DSGHVFVTGGSRSSDGNTYDYATIAYSSAGAPLWTNRYNGPGNSDDQAVAVTVNGSGHVFVTGYSAGSGTGLDYATIAYSSAGAALWTNRYNGPLGYGNDQAQALTVDGSGNVYVTGYSYSGVGNMNADYATLAYSSAGVPLWTNRYDGPGNDEDTPVAVA